MLVPLVQPLLLIPLVPGLVPGLLQPLVVRLERVRRGAGLCQYLRHGSDLQRPSTEAAASVAGRQRRSAVWTERTAAG